MGGYGKIAFANEGALLDKKEYATLITDALKECITPLYIFEKFHFHMLAILVTPRITAKKCTPSCALL